MSKNITHQHTQITVQQLYYEIMIARGLYMGGKDEALAALEATYAGNPIVAREAAEIRAARKAHNWEVWSGDVGNMGLM